MIIGYKNNAPQRITIKRSCQVYYLRWWYSGWHYWAFLPGKQSLITEGEKYRTIGTKSVMMSTGQITFEQCQAIRTILNTREVHIFTSDGWKNVIVNQGGVIVYDNQVNGYEIELRVKIGSKEISVTGFSPIADVPIIPIPDPGLCETIIGTQIWMCKNYDSDFPGSKVYNNDEANRAIFGGLYTWDQITNPGFCPDGWHIPTLVEWQTLIAYAGGDAIAGGKLKEIGTTHWNAGIDGTDDYGFKALGAGSFLSVFNFYGLKDISNLWLIDPSDPEKAYFVSLFYDRIDLTVSYLSIPNAYYFSVRLIKNNIYIPVSYNDWFLPSKDELSAMYTELHLYGVGNFSEITFYWSSTEINSDYARSFGFNGYGLESSFKSTPLYVRACRAFASTTNYNLRDIGPAGGWIFWKSGNDYLETATDDFFLIRWSTVDNIEIGVTAQGTAIGTGEANTTAIINQVGHIDSAAKLCTDLVIIH